jgi:hypothetical protein
MSPSFLRRKRRQRADVSSYSALIASPATTTVVLPASGRIGIYTESAQAADTTAATLSGAFRVRTTEGLGAVTDKVIKTPLIGDEGGRVVIDRLEKGVSITVEAGFVVQVDIGMGAWRTICN